MTRNPWQDISYKFRTGNKLYMLMLINVIVFLFTLLFPALESWFLLPANLPALVKHFWTPLSCLVLNEGLFSIIFNVLWLYWMGQIFEEYLGNKRILGLYLLGGLTGAILFVLSNNITGDNFVLNVIDGAPISILTVVVATATLLPNYTVMLFIWPVKLKWVVLIYAIVDLVNIRGMGFSVIMAHAGGALIGFLYIKQLNNGSDWITWITNLFKARSRLKVAAKNPSKKVSSRPRQEEVDRILDKISKSGYEHLSKEEKEILFRASKNES